MKLIDLSHKIEPGMPKFSPTIPDPEIYPFMSHKESAEGGNYQNCTCEVTEAKMVTSIGTYMDSPYHFNIDGTSIEKLRLEQLVLPGVMIDCREAKANEAIPPEVLESVDFSGKAVLIKTGWSNYWGQEEYYQFPFLGKEISEALRDGGAKLVGVDFMVVDSTKDPTRPAHTTLLNNNVLIVENLTHLHNISKDKFVFHAAPVKVTGAAAFPVRAYAVEEE